MENCFQQLLQSLDSGHKAVQVTRINTTDGQPGRSETIVLQEDDLNQTVRIAIKNSEITGQDFVIVDLAKSALIDGRLNKSIDPAGNLVLVEPFYPEPQLIVFGGGHIAVPLVSFAAQAGFKVTVIDDRPSFANTIRFPAAHRVICDSFPSSFARIELTPATFVVIITRGHRHDTLCLVEALKHETAYVGMIGSRRRVQIVRDQLLVDGYDKAKLDQVQSPIGLPIGAVTPTEIAISILAQLISFRRQARQTAQSTPAPGAKSAKQDTWPEFDRQVIEHLAGHPADDLAIVTIIETKGSVPRKTGAKMLVFADGRTLGSIGGGCSEGEVITAARSLIHSGGCQVVHVDMTGQVAEDDGMVCGGVMDVLVFAPGPQWTAPE